MQNLETAYRSDIVAHDRIRLPARSGKTSFVDTRDIACAPILGGEGQPPLDEAPAQGARAHAIAGVLLAREVHEPDISLELAGSRERQELFGREQQGRGRRVVVVGAAGGCTEEIAAGLGVVDVLHVRGVVVVAHHDGLAAILARDDHHDVALGGGDLVLRPALHPRELEVGLPPEHVIDDLGLADHPVRLDQRPVASVQVIAERFEVPALVRVDVRRLRGRSAVLAAIDGDAIGIVLLAELAMGEAVDRSPDLLLEVPRAEPIDHERCTRLVARIDAVAERRGQPRARRVIRGVLRQLGEPRLERELLADVEQRPRVARLQRHPERVAHHDSS